MPKKITSEDIRPKPGSAKRSYNHKNQQVKQVDRAQVICGHANMLPLQPNLDHRFCPDCAQWVHIDTNLPHTGGPTNP